MGRERDRKLKNDRKCVQFKIFFVIAVCLGIFSECICCFVSFICFFMKESELLCS